MPKVHFSDFFNVASDDVDRYGAFNVSLLQDLPLFVDPFLLFNSDDPAYQELHEEIIRYLRFLKEKSQAGKIHSGLVQAWFLFPEVKQTWLGYSLGSNAGSGLGWKFARALNDNLANIFGNFGDEQVTRSSHLEKLCLVEKGVGRDNISDFTTNLIKGYLCEYTEEFALMHLSPRKRFRVSVNRVRFNYDTESWESGVFELPYDGEDYVLLTPKDLLTKDETWINKKDLYGDFADVADALPNEALRAQVNNYFLSKLPKQPKKRDEREAIRLTIRRFPQLIEHFIRLKEDHGDLARALSEEKVAFTADLFVHQLARFVEGLFEQTAFYDLSGTTLDEARRRALFLKDVIENKGGHRIFYAKGERIRRESDLHILFRLTWFATPSDVSREVDDGRGPADFKISRGSFDKSIIEFKLASNRQLKRNLQNQVEIYKKASDANAGLKVIVYFDNAEYDRLSRILSELQLTNDPNIILIDAGADNKPSASKA